MHGFPPVFLGGLDSETIPRPPVLLASRKAPCGGGHAYQVHHGSHIAREDLQKKALHAMIESNKSFALSITILNDTIAKIRSTYIDFQYTHSL